MIRGDRPAQDETKEIEITPEMIEAGVVILWNIQSDLERLESDRLVVSDIYRAMRRLEEKGGEVLRRMLKAPPQPKEKGESRSPRPPALEEDPEDGRDAK